ncbi:MAG: site-specific DNA-methyltransferase [Candidatus Zixiibacteriota bacterium]
MSRSVLPESATKSQDQMKIIGNDLLAEIASLEDDLTREYSGRLVVNQDLDRTLVSFQANKRESGSRWCKYKEAFSAALIRYIFQKVGPIHGRILDPFAGSGTALFGASEAGIDAVGIELLPCSAEIIRVRSAVESTNKEKLASVIREHIKARSWEGKGISKKFNHLRITAGAFPDETEYFLGRYLYDTESIDDEDVRRLLQFAALCVLESVSYTRKDGQYLRWDSRSGRRSGGRPFDKGPIFSFTQAIEGKLLEIINDLYGVSTLFDGLLDDRKRGKIDVLEGSCLDVLPLMEPDQFDGLITSPPYCNRYDYTRTYALELAMMGIGEEELKSLRQTMLSCTVENREKVDLERKFGNEVYEKGSKAFESQTLLQRILCYLEWCKADKSLNNIGIPRMVRNYFHEMALVIFECARVLKPCSPFVMVNDNVRYQGVHIPVDLVMSEFAAAAGFEVEAIWVLPKGKGNSSQQMGEHGRQEVRKCVYVWRLKA